MLALAVKGNRYQAERAAENRGISFAVQGESRYGETIGVTAMEHLELVRAWHGENVGSSDAALTIGSKRARHRQRQAAYEASLRDDIGLFPTPLRASEIAGPRWCDIVSAPTFPRMERKMG